MEKEMHKVFENIINSMNDDDMLLSFMFRNTSADKGEVILSKSGDNDEFVYRLSALILNGLRSESDDQASQASVLLYIMENTVLTLMMEEDEIYKKVTNHIMQAKASKTLAEQNTTHIVGEA